MVTEGGEVEHDLGAAGRAGRLRSGSRRSRPREQPDAPHDLAERRWSGELEVLQLGHRHQVRRISGCRLFPRQASGATTSSGCSSEQRCETFHRLASILSPTARGSCRSHARCSSQSWSSSLRRPPSPARRLPRRRYVRDGRAVDFEFTRIDQTDSGAVITPHPKGVRSVSFAPKTIERNRAVWENSAHDFPQRILYTRVADDTLVARIEGRTPSGDRALEWRMMRATCEARPRAP
jgi:hypothetical protein